jgi:GumC protein
VEKRKMLLTNSNMLSLRDGLQALFRRRKLVLLIFVLTVVPVGVATFTAPKIYRATAKVLVRREDRLGALNPYYSRLNQEEDIRSELEIASSGPVLENVLRASLSQGQYLDNLDAAMYQSLTDAERQPDNPHNGAMVEKARDRLRRHLTVEAVTGANVIEIGFEDLDPARAAWFANALANAYATYNAQVRGGGGAENFLAERIEETRSRLDSLEKALYAYRTSSGLAADDRQQAIMYEQYRVTDQQLAQLRERAEVLAGKVARLRQARTAGDSLVIPTAEMDAHPSVRMLYSKLTELRLERNVLVEKYKSDHRLVADLDKQIHGVQTELVAEVDRLLALEDERLNSLRQEESVLSKSAANVRWSIKSLPEKERVLNELELAIDNARKIYSLLVMRREEMSVENAADRRLSRITIISLAGVPYEPISPRPGRNMLLGLILGALAGIAGGLAREFFDGTFKSPQEVSLALQVPVLGAISAKTKTHHLKSQTVTAI